MLFKSIILAHSSTVTIRVPTCGNGKTWMEKLLKKIQGPGKVLNFFDNIWKITILLKKCTIVSSRSCRHIVPNSFWLSWF
jgi:hypothetical protein